MHLSGSCYLLLLVQLFVVDIRNKSCREDLNNTTACYTHLQKKTRQADPLKRGGSPESKMTKEQIKQEEYKFFTMLVIFYVKRILSQHCIDLSFLYKTICHICSF